MAENIMEYLEEKFNLEETKINTYSPLVLAYIGDAVYELIIRTIIVRNGNMQVNKMNELAKTYVKASSQAKAFNAISQELSEEEILIFKRGRNAKTITRAKNSTLNEYKIATGFESLIGYLYLTKRYERLIDLIAEGVEGCKKQKDL